MSPLMVSPLSLEGEAAGGEGVESDVGSVIPPHCGHQLLLSSDWPVYVLWEGLFDVSL